MRKLSMLLVSAATVLAFVITPTSAGGQVLPGRSVG